MSLLVIDPDKFKESIAGYDPLKAEEFHTQSAKMADQAYAEAIKDRVKYKNIILLCGGSAVGKSEFISTYLSSMDDTIIFDSTLSSRSGVKTKLNESRVRSKFNVTVIFIQPESILQSFIAFQGRDRQFPHTHFIRTHSGSRDTFLYVLEKYDTINYRYFISSIDTSDKMLYKEVIADREKVIEAIRDEQISEQVLEESLKPYLNN